MALLAAQIVIGKIFHLQLVGRALQAFGIGGRNHGIGQLPDAADGILEAAVAIHHHFHVLAGGGQQSILQLVHKFIAVMREQLHLVLGGLVAAQDAILRVIAAAIHGGGHDIVHAQHACALGAQNALGARAGVDIAGNDLVGILQNIGGIVGENHAGVGREGTVILNVVHAGKGMDGVVAKHLAEALVIKALTVRIHALFIQRIPGQQGIAHLVGRIAQLHHYALGRSHGHRP